jgi:hypothetical protein
MFDEREYNDNIRSFVESIEPDFNYQGTDGLLSLAIESAENVLTINAFVEAESKKEEEGKGFFGTIGGWIKTAFNKIIEFIKKIIAKVKSLFLTFVHKIKSLYASAVKKIGELLNKAVDYKDNRAEVTWWQLTPKFEAAMKAIAETNFKISKKAEASITSFVAAGASAGAEVWGELPESAKSDVKEAIDDAKDILNDISGVEFAKKAGILVENKSQRLKKEQFDAVYSGTIMKNLNGAYEKAMSINKELLKLADGAKVKIEKKAAKVKKGSDKAKTAVNFVSFTVNAATGIITKLMNGCFSIAIFAFHQALKATLYGLKGTVGAKIRKGRNWASDKLATPKEESFEIEDYDGYDII